MSRAAISAARRVVIKVGSSSLTGSAGAELDPRAVQKVVDVALIFKKQGADVVPGGFVLRTGIPQPHDQPWRFGHVPTVVMKTPQQSTAGASSKRC